MSVRYRNDKFNFSKMTERLTIQTQNSDGSYTDTITVWANITKDGFTRSENENWFKIMVRDQSALISLLELNGRLKWKRMTLSILSWQDPPFKDKGFVEILAKQVATNDRYYNVTDIDLFKDIVSIFRLQKTEVTSYGLTSYEYNYDFDNPIATDVRCYFETDRNIYLDNKKIDVEHDSLVVKFNSNVPIMIEDYIISPIHGKFKVDMIVKTNDNMIEARVQRGETQ